MKNEEYKTKNPLSVENGFLLCCITPKRCLEVGKYSKMIRLIK